MRIHVIVWYIAHCLGLMYRRTKEGQKSNREYAYKISEKFLEKLVNSKIIYNFALAKAKHLRSDGCKMQKMAG